MPKPVLGKVLRPKAGVQLSIFLELKIFFSLHPNGHVMRRDQEYAGKKRMKMELPGKRKRRRPKRKFLDVGKEDMEEVGAKETDVEDRTVWRKMIRCGYS